MVELATVLVVMGIVLAIGIPAFSKYARSSNVRNTYRQVALDLRLARQRALAERHNVVAVFASGPPATFNVFSDDDNDGTRDAGERWLVQRTLDPTVALDASALAPADTVTFAPSGSLLAGSSGGVVNVSHTGDLHDRTLRIWPSGAVEIVD